MVNILINYLVIIIKKITIFNELNNNKYNGCASTLFGDVD